MWLDMTFNVNSSLKSIISWVSNAELSNIDAGPDQATELSKLTQKFCIDLDFSELQSDKLVKYLNTDWLFMATLKGCKSGCSWSPVSWSCYRSAARVLNTCHNFGENTHQNADLKYSNLNIPQVALCPGTEYVQVPFLIHFSAVHKTKIPRVHNLSK